MSLTKESSCATARCSSLKTKESLIGILPIFAVRKESSSASMRRMSLKTSESLIRAVRAESERIAGVGTVAV